MRVLLEKIKLQLREKLHEEQAGLIGGRATIDQIFVFRQIIEKDGSMHNRYIARSRTSKKPMIRYGEMECGSSQSITAFQTR